MENVPDVADKFAQFARGGSLLRLTALQVLGSLGLPLDTRTCLPFLERIEISIREDEFIHWRSLASCSSVTYLAIANDSGEWGNAFIRWPGPGQLRELCLVGSIPASGLLGLTALTCLDVHGYHPHHFVSSIGTLTTLQRLSLHGSDVDVQALARLSRLTELRLNGDWPIVRGDDWGAMSSLRQLLRLHISANGGAVHLRRVAPAIRQLPQLQWLEVDGEAVRLV